MKYSSNDSKIIEMLKNQVKGLEHELRYTESRKSEEVHESLAKIEELKIIISELREKVNKTAEIRAERERKFRELESMMKKESEENRGSIEHIENEDIFEKLCSQKEYPNAVKFITEQVCLKKKNLVKDLFTDSKSYIN